MGTTAAVQSEFTLNMAAVAIDAGYAYAFGNGKHLYQSSDGDTWTSIASLSGTISASITGMDVVDGVVYLCTNDCHIWKGTPSATPSMTMWVDDHGSPWITENGEFWVQ
jgi:hypothetical protein